MQTVTPPPPTAIPCTLAGRSSNVAMYTCLPLSVPFGSPPPPVPCILTGGPPPYQSLFDLPLVPCKLTGGSPPKVPVGSPPSTL